MVRPVSRRSEVVQAAYKNEEGLVRFTFVIDLPRKRIKDVFITGDILSFPGRALFDLESALRGTPMEMDSLSRVINGFFADGLIRVPGMTAEDFLKPVEQAVRKVEIAKYGIPLEYCNLISVANGTFEEVLKRRPSVLLLPYCSKDLQCELRYRKGCRVCGECSIGPAWTMGRMKDMKVVCVVSFEDLMGELKKMKADGVSAYIGCCCRPFFTKHVDDFERVGVPGILLDIDDTTCYELDQAREAYAGRFSSQTRVNLDLLDAVMNTRVA
jgi:lipoate-protein ligase A